MIVHICCSVDSHYFLQKLKLDFPDEKIIGFFYNPNIHPYSEYLLRLQDVKRSCKILDIKLIEGKYEFQKWLEITKGFENTPEKGKRCELCFDDRLEETAKLAANLNHSKYTTTLLMSPKKSHKQILERIQNIDKKYNTQFVLLNYRKNDGIKYQNIQVKKNYLYRQDYCGCFYALISQRETQKIFCDELISPINKAVLPASIEEKIKFYQNVEEMQNSGKRFNIAKERFLNYRILLAKVSIQNKVIPSHFLFYSTLKKEKITGKIDFKKGNISYLDKEGIKFIDLKTYNALANAYYKTVKELAFSQDSYLYDKKVRMKIAKNSYDLSSIIVIEDTEIAIRQKIEIFLKYSVYEDIREILVTFG